MNILESIYQITLYILPLCLIVLIVFLIILVVRLFESVKKLNEVLDKSKTTVDYINLSLSEIQKPLNTLGKISIGIELAYDFSEKTVRNFVDKIIELVNSLRVWVSAILNKEEEVEVQEVTLDE